MLSWNVRVKGGDPFDLTGQDLSLYRLGFNGRERIETFEVYGNVVKWSWPGAEQNSPGTYSFLLVMNENKEGMRTLEACEALRLVASSCGTCIGMPDHVDLEGILDDYLQAVDKANEAADKAIRAANEASKVISSMESALDSIKKLLSSGSVYIGVLSSGGNIPKADSNVFMLCGPGDYSVDGSPAKVGIGQLGILSNASGQWKMETVQVVEVLQSLDNETAFTSPNPPSASAILTFLDEYLMAVMIPGVFAASIPGWKEFFSKIDTIKDITDPLDFSETNYLTKEENLKDACMQLDEEVKATNDNITVLGAEAANLAKTKQDKLAAGKANEFLEGSSDGPPVWTSVFNVVSKMLTRSNMRLLNAGDDLDNIVTPGVYRTNTPSSNIANVPFPGKSFVMYVVETGSVGEFVQIVVTTYSESNIYVRSCYNETNWQPWQQIVTSTNTDLAMRPIYEACGAVWNEETGYYELNGLTDITEAEMLTIYTVFSDYKIEDINWKYAYTKARTNICPKNATYASKAYPNFNGQRAFYYSAMEVIKISGIPISPDFGFALSQGGNMFDSCGKLKRIIGRLWVDKSNSLYAIFNKCPKLEEVQIYGLSLPISFSDSPLLNYASLDCLITNAANTAAITVTVHPTTYSYLAGTAQPTEEVGGTTEEWQALMTTAAGKQISFATEE